jgi:hypothetical protein
MQHLSPRKSPEEKQLETGNERIAYSDRTTIDFLNTNEFKIEIPRVKAGNSIHNKRSEEVLLISNQLGIHGSGSASNEQVSSLLIANK